MAETTKARVRVQAGRGGGPKETGTAVAVAQSKPPVAAPTTFIGMIHQIAMDPNVDPAKMQAIIDVQERLEDRAARRAYNTAFIRMQKQLPQIDRDGKIEVRAKDARTGERTGKIQQSSPFSTYPKLMEVCKPIMDKHGFGLTSKVKPGPDGKILVITTLLHDEGHSDASEFPLGADTTGSKNNNQGWGSSQQYGMRYNAIALLNIVSRYPKDLDKNGYEGEFRNSTEGLVEVMETVLISPAQIEELKMVMHDCGVTEQQFLGRYHIDKLSDLPADMLEASKAAMRRHKEQQSGKGGNRG